MKGPSVKTIPTKTQAALFERETSSLAEKAFCQLEERIVTGSLAPESKWSEGALGQLIGIGRTPIREAVQRLSANGLLHVIPRQGIVVSKIDSQRQLMVYDCRRAIELLVVPRATSRASAVERKALSALAASFAEVARNEDVLDYMRAHFEMTRMLGEISRNLYAADFYASLQTSARRFHYFHQARYTDFASICDMHRQQVQTMADGDEAAAIAMVHQRNDYAESAVKRVLMDLIETAQVTITPAERKQRRRSP
jgi:DNA-binding GntR family transcriptional regulator